MKALGGLVYGLVLGGLVALTWVLVEDASWSEYPDAPAEYGFAVGVAAGMSYYLGRRREARDA